MLKTCTSGPLSTCCQLSEQPLLPFSFKLILNLALPLQYVHQQPAIGPAIEDAIEGAIEAAIDAEMGPAIDATIGPAIEEAVGAAISESIGPAINATVAPVLNAAMDAAIVPAINAAFASPEVKAIFEAQSTNLQNLIRSRSNRAALWGVDEHLDPLFRLSASPPDLPPRNRFPATTKKFFSWMAVGSARAANNESIDWLLDFYGVMDPVTKVPFPPRSVLAEGKPGDDELERKHGLLRHHLTGLTYYDTVEAQQL
ncbi:hypothetical protein KFL_000880070 [Klebsormidium nitens]|uniref:Uncharacterized protein n=1 Tax=Klebsormidium nitens TaxID=105231 RepID=A0A1Y1HU85_KLENI|nr:hypothetical protein KFL_000880070 [Klebsormidium nitens]|eukprot:GAQ81693.1 hypothetical protein KFL_000880070 [Klebsormidium nitens]